MKITFDEILHIARAIDGDIETSKKGLIDCSRFMEQNI